jgi:obg-like ATPase 1
VSRAAAATRRRTAMPPKKKTADDGADDVGAAKFGRVRNNLRMGIVGLPNVGKSSLFNILTEQSIAAENYPFCTIDPNEARCPVPDARYDRLVSMWKPASEYPAFLSVTDIAGLVRGASSGAGLGNAFLSNIMATDGIFHVVRAFDDPEVVHVDDEIDPVRDLETITAELCLKDLETVKRAIADEERDVKKNPTMKLSALFKDTMARCTEMLENNLAIRTGEWNTPEVEMIKDKLPALLTTKPMIYLVNLSKRDYVRKKNKWLPKIHAWVQQHGGGIMIPFSVEFEQELFDLGRRRVAALGVLRRKRRREIGVAKDGDARVQGTESHVLLHRGREGSAMLDRVQRCSRSSSRWRHSHRFREGLHQG